MFHWTNSINTKAKRHFPEQEPRAQNFHMPGVKSAVVVWLLPELGLNSGLSVTHVHTEVVPLTFSIAYSIALYESSAF